MVDEDGYFGERVAEQYDQPSSPQFRRDVIERTVDLLEELAGDGRALELGIGTGRIALPLARRGVPVHGIELSRAMVARMRAKPGGEGIGVSIGDFATTTVDTTGDGAFSLAYLVFNTIMNLTSQEAQVACFRNVAEHLAPGGCFVIEVMVPELRKIPAGQNIVPFHTSPTGWAYTVYDTVTQDATCHYIEVSQDGRGEARTVPFRYVWPAELDLMAQLAGLRLRDRWDGWTRKPFTQDSIQHVSVWEKPTRPRHRGRDPHRGE
ncbi:class I SAM-dependent methyltransferase [Streptomyces sp. NPDC006208]|uniref:class I SAM-dependent DNA methyltransferase n=1 Tax=Streptomyces sp. NPDC006208 TaxID=3156734 RepID=UPI0033ABE89F